MRAAVEADAPALAAIARAAYAPYVPRLGFEPPPMRQDFPADIAAGRVWAAEWADGGGRDGAGLLGYAVARPEGPDWMIENVARAPDGFAEEQHQERNLDREVPLRVVVGDVLLPRRPDCRLHIHLERPLRALLLRGALDG